MECKKPKIFVVHLNCENPVLLLSEQAEGTINEEFELVSSASLEKDPQLLTSVEGLVAALPWATQQNEMLRKAPNVKIISVYGVGFEFVDVEYCRSHGIRVGYTPYAVTHGTADMAIGLVITTARMFAQGMRFAQQGQSPQILSKEVHASTLGIVGMGRIESQVARRASGFDMEILYHNRTRRLQAEKDLNATYCESLHDMLPRCDFVVITCPLTSETRHMFGNAEFQLMKRDAIIVNVARGGIIDTDALVKALQEKLIGGAGLDVTEPEPLPKEHPLLHMDNVIIMPHWGSATVATRRQMDLDTVANLRAVIKEGKLPVYNACQ